MIFELINYQKSFVKICNQLLWRAPVSNLNLILFQTEFNFDVHVKTVITIFTNNFVYLIVDFIVALTVRTYIYILPHVIKMSWSFFPLGLSVDFFLFDIHTLWKWNIILQACPNSFYLFLSIVCSQNLHFLFRFVDLIVGCVHQRYNTQHNIHARERKWPYVILILSAVYHLFAVHIILLWRE